MPSPLMLAAIKARQKGEDVGTTIVKHLIKLVRGEPIETKEETKIEKAEIEEEKEKPRKFKKRRTILTLPEEATLGSKTLLGG